MIVVIVLITVLIMIVIAIIIVPVLAVISNNSKGSTLKLPVLPPLGSRPRIEPWI